jgi:hypothetical protein
MKAHQKQGFFYLVGAPAHVGHDKGRRHGEYLTPLFKPNPTAAQLLFPRKIGEAVERIAPAQGLWKSFGIKLMEFLKPALGIGTIGEKLVILGLTEGQTDRTVPFFRWMRYSRHGCLDVWRML